MNKMTTKKYSLYYIEDEKIIEYSKLSVEDKLNWLEDAMIFNLAVFTDKDLAIRKKMLEGDYENNQDSQ